MDNLDSVNATRRAGGDVIPPVKSSFERNLLTDVTGPLSIVFRRTCYRRHESRQYRVISVIGCIVRTLSKGMSKIFAISVSFRGIDLVVSIGDPSPFLVELEEECL
jgi:hypothetical protein